MLKTIKDLNTFTGPKVRFYLVISVFAGIAWFLCELSFVYVFQYFLYSLKLIDRSQLSFDPERLSQLHVSGPIALIAFGFFRLVANFVKNVMSSYVQHTFIQEKRSQVLSIALAKAGSLPTGQIISYFSEIVSQAGTVIFYVSNAIIAAVSLGLFIVAGFVILPYEMAISISLLMLFIFPYKYFSKNIVAYGKVLTTEWEEVNNSLVNLIKNNVFIKIYNLNKSVTQKGTASLLRYEHSFKKYTINHSLVTLIPPAYGLIIIAFVSSLFIKDDRSDPIKLISFLYLFLRMAQAASETLGTLAFLKLNRFAYLKLMNWFQTPVTPDQGSLINDVSEIHLKNMGFSYDQNELILKDIDLKFCPGDFVVIKGTSGSGKSTLLSLILGLQKPTEGQILINGVEHRDFSLSPSIGYVGPTPFLINGTIFENMALGSVKQFSEESMLDALDKVLLGEKVRSFKNGVHEILNEEAQLSTGQKQRLCIARVLLHSPKIIILDEATANLDQGSEKEIIRSIKGKFQNDLVIVVTHKDSFDPMATRSINLNN